MSGKVRLCLSCVFFRRQDPAYSSFPSKENVSIFHSVAYFTEVGLHNEFGIAANETSNVKKECMHVHVLVGVTCSA